MLGVKLFVRELKLYSETTYQFFSPLLLLYQDRVGEFSQKQPRSFPQGGAAGGSTGEQAGSSAGDGFRETRRSRSIDGNMLEPLPVDYDDYQPDQMEGHSRGSNG